MMKKKLLFLVMGCLTISACRKNNDSPEPHGSTSTTGNPLSTTTEVSGSISPAGAAMEIIVYAVVNSLPTYTSVMLDQNNSFKISDLTPGDYTLIIVPATGFTKAENIPVNITPGKKISLGSIKLNTAPAAETGTVIGTISPIGAASQINVFAAYKYYSAQPNPVTGRFYMTNVPKGDYTISSMATPNFAGPTTGVITVNTGQITDAGTLRFGPNQLVSELSCKVGSRTISWDTYTNNGYRGTNITTSFNGSNLEISGRYVTGAPSTPEGGTTTSLAIKISNITGPGTYVCDSRSASAITYASIVSNSFTNLTYKSSLEDASVTVVVKAFDSIAKTVSGTLSGTLKAKAFNGTVSAQNLTDGVFNIQY